MKIRLLELFAPHQAKKMLYSVAAGVLLASSICAIPMRADDFTKPTAEELKMTSLPGHPGAPAVILNYEEITKDDLHVHRRWQEVCQCGASFRRCPLQ